MDQQSFYELQSSPLSTVCEQEYILKGRDDFIIDYVKTSILGDRARKLNLAELSIGDGRLTMALLQSTDLIDLTCADISAIRIELVSSMVKYSSSSLEARAHFVVCNFDTHFDLLADDAFDAVIALDIMEHVFDVFNFVRHCGRILRNYGTLILRVPNVAYIRHRFNLLVGALPVTASWFGTPGELIMWREYWGWDGGHLHFFTIPTLIKLLKGYGFVVQLCRDPGTRFEFLRNLSPNLMYANPVIIARKEK